MTDVEVLVIGGGQAGLGIGYHLARAGTSFLIVDAAAQLGHGWRRRWESLTLFTPRRFSSLPGWRLPAGTGRYPSKDEMACYLERYAARFDLPVRLGHRIDSLEHDADGFTARAPAGQVHARHVVVATGPFHRPHVPACGRRLNRDITQLHSYHYQNPADIPAGEVLVVGGGNSGAQLAGELAATHSVTLATDGPPWFVPETILGASLYWWLYLTGVLHAGHNAPVSRYIRRRGDAIVGLDLQNKIKSGQVRLHPHRLHNAHGSQVTFADGTQLNPPAILWCTGFRPDYRWIHVPGAVDETGAPVQAGGASPVPRLHWLGLPWQTRLNSSLIDGIDHDAKLLAARIREAR